MFLVILSSYGSVQYAYWYYFPSSQLAQGFDKRNTNKIKMIACQSYIHNVACSCYVSLDYSIFGSFVNDTDVVLRSFLVEKHVFAL